MGLFSRLFGAKSEAGKTVEELARRMKMGAEQLMGVAVSYRKIEIAKRSGGTRVLMAPADPLKAVQRTMLRRVLGRLQSHPAAMGFEMGRSIATNALPHVGARVVLKMDLRDFFGQTSARRMREYFVHIGWGGEAADLLVKLTTHGGGLPQGAPTSPRLSNLVNYGLDARLFAAALKLGFIYTRYADDMTFSLHEGHAGTLQALNPKTLKVEARPATPQDERASVAAMIQCTQDIVKDFGYHLHTAKKLKILRRHQRMEVTGVVVNEKMQLPRETRRRLRAVEHRLKTGKAATMTAVQLRGWHALESMVAAMRDGGS